MGHPLQNHPGLVSRPELPLRVSFRNLALDARANGSMPTAVVSWIVLGAGILFFLAWVDHGPVDTLREAEGSLGAFVESAGLGVLIFWGSAALIGLACVALGVQLALTAMRRPLREQARYYRLRGLTEVSARQRRALRIGGHWWYLKATWPLSMECFPISEGMTERQVRSFRTFLPEAAHKDRDDLASDWGILNAQEARSTIDQHLTGGVHSVALATLRDGSGQRAELRARRASGEDYLRSEWPATLGPWPTSSGRPLPPAMADGFQAVLTEE